MEQTGEGLEMKACYIKMVSLTGVQVSLRVHGNFPKVFGMDSYRDHFPDLQLLYVLFPQDDVLKKHPAVEILSFPPSPSKSLFHRFLNGVHFMLIYLEYCQGTLLKVGWGSVKQKSNSKYGCLQRLSFSIIAGFCRLFPALYILLLGVTSFQVLFCYLCIFPFFFFPKVFV